MLVLSQKPGQRVLIGDNIVLTTIRIGPNSVRYGIEAPREMNVVRSELVRSEPNDELKRSVNDAA